LGFIVIFLSYVCSNSHGVPANADAFVHISEKAEISNHTGGPYIVHCSAGVGRTGTFILIANEMERVLDRKKKKQSIKVDPFSTALKIRYQRPSSIQTEEQFLFCYQSIARQLQLLLSK
jgi:protein tyrosine phosphatase